MPVEKPDTVAMFRCCGKVQCCNTVLGWGSKVKCFQVNAVTVHVHAGMLVALTDGKSKGKRHSTRAHPPRGGAAKPGVSSTQRGEIVRLPKVSAE